MKYKNEGLGTTHIAVRSATNLLHGVRFATDQGTPLNTEVIIAWHRLGIDDDQASGAFRALRRSVCQAWKYRDRVHGLQLGPVHDVATHENPGGAYGPLRNTHWMIRVPSAFMPAFKALVAKFLAKAVRVELGAARTALMIRTVNAPGSLAKYICKGLDPTYGDHLHIDPEPQGFIGGRGRTFVSRALSRATRKREGWVRKRRPRNPKGSGLVRTSQPVSP